jgi:iron(III) transport system permease protein
VSRRAPSWLTTVSLLTAGLISIPIVYLFVRALENGWQPYLSALASPRVALLTWRSTALSVSVLLLSLVIALPAAWLVARTDLPFRRLWAVLIALPLVFPSYVAAFCWVSFFGPKGYLQSWLAGLGVERLPEIVYGFSGATLVLGFFTYPYVYLLLVGALRALDRSLEESSRSLGVGRFATFRRVVLPQLRPALYAGSLLVVLYTLSDFGAVSIVRFNTYTLAIFNAYSGLFDRSLAAALATALVLLTALWIALEAWLAGRLRPAQERRGARSPLIALGKWKWPSLAGLSIVVGLALVIPSGVIGFWGVRALLRGGDLGRIGVEGLNSVSVSLVAAFVATLLSIAPTVWAKRYPGAMSKWVERACHAGYALPGLVIGLAWVFLATRTMQWAYQTLSLLVVAYVVRFLPEALAATRSALSMVPESLEEAARALGRRPISVLRSVTMPLMRPGLLVGAALVFLTAMKELPATLILRPTGFETLATRVWSTASEGIYSEAALPALLLLVLSALPIYRLVIAPVLSDR